MTGKERAMLKSIAQNLKATFQIGKEGISAEFINQIDDYLEKNEIVKIRVLNNSSEDVKEAQSFLMEELNCEFVQQIGSIFVIYRESLKRPSLLQDEK